MGGPNFHLPIIRFFRGSGPRCFRLEALTRALMMFSDLAHQARPRRGGMGHHGGRFIPENLTNFFPLKILGWNMKFSGNLGKRPMIQGRTVSFRPGGTMLEKENSNEHVKDIGERGFYLFSNHLEPITIEASQGLGWKMTITSRDSMMAFIPGGWVG